MRTVPLKILMAEDEIGLAMLMERQLEDMGYTLHTHVTTGKEAVEAAVGHKPDVIFMDIRLAGPMDGIEAARLIGEGGCGAPVIFITGYDDPGTRERARGVSPLGFFTKPLQPRDLQPLLEKL